MHVSQDALPGDAFALSLNKVWEVIRSQKDLNLPAHKVCCNLSSPGKHCKLSGHHAGCAACPRLTCWSFACTLKQAMPCRSLAFLPCHVPCRLHACWNALSVHAPACSEHNTGLNVSSRTVDLSSALLGGCTTASPHCRLAQVTSVISDACLKLVCHDHQ